MKIPKIVVLFCCLLLTNLATVCQAQQYYNPQTPYSHPIQPNWSPQAAHRIEPQPHWTQQLVDAESKHHDFGSVPYQSQQEHVFEFKNPFDYPIQLIGIRTSCGCTRPEILTRSVAPAGIGRVRAIYETAKFDGSKKATITVSVRRDKPFTEYGEVQFSVTGFIRRDVVLTPGELSFSDMVLGQPAKRIVKVLYAGNPEWRIKDVSTSNPNIEVSVKETLRDAQTRRVDYELAVDLKASQPVGSFADQIVINTNDVNNKHLAINLHGNVKAVVQVSPIRLGIIEMGQKIERRMIVRGMRPFGIKSVRTSDNRIVFTPSNGSKTLHAISFQVDTSRSGKIVSEIHIETDDPDQQSAVVSFEAQIVPETYASDLNQTPQSE
jgi:hypothetical protein